MNKILLNELNDDGPRPALPRALSLLEWTRQTASTHTHTQTSTIEKPKDKDGRQQEQQQQEENNPWRSKTQPKILFQKRANK